MNDDWKNFEPRKNAPGIAKERQDVCPTCKREKRPVIDYDDDAAIRKLARHQLIAIIDVDKPSIAHTAPIRELVDRLDGKAPQSIAMTVKVDPVSRLTDDQLALLLANCPNPMIIPPLPKKLDID